MGRTHAYSGEGYNTAAAFLLTVELQSAGLGVETANSFKA